MAIPRRPTKGQGKPGQPAAAAAARPGGRAPTPQQGRAAPPADELEDFEVGESPEDISAAETLPVAPVGQGRKRTSGKQPPRPPSGGGASGGSGLHKSPSGQLPSREQLEEAREAHAPARKGRGGEIGSMQRRGMSLAQKLVIFTVLVTLPISVIFGLVSIRDLEEQLKSEIKRSGKQQALVLNTFAQRVIDRVRGVRDPGQFQKIVNDYKTPPPPDENAREGETAQKMRALLDGQYKDDLARLKAILAGDQRIKDVVIFASTSATDNPSTPLLRAGDSPEFAKPSSVEEDGSGVQIYSGSYGGENCFYFRFPLEKDKADANKMYSFASVILSAGEIDAQVGSLKKRLLLFGLVLIGLGIGASLGVANWFTRPINSLVEDVNIVSQGDLEHTSTVPGQTSDEVGLLAMAFNRMTKNLRDAREMERDKERLDSELNTAKAIHAKLMPEKLPQLPGIDIFTAYNCAKEVGGDYYDFIPVGDMEHLALCVADVSGKGIPGSMVMGTTRTILRMMAVNNLSAKDVLAKTNFHVARDIKRGMFVTCIYAILNVRTRELTIASAGHNPMLIWRQATKQIEKVRPNGIALGFDKGPVFNRTVQEQKVKLNTGDRVVMYTDGVVESMNEKREEWTDEALDAFTLKNAALPSKEYVRLLIKALEEHQGRAEQHDDITITTFRML